MIKLPVKLFIIKLFPRINVFKKMELPFCVTFFTENMMQRTLHLRELFLAIKKQGFFIKTL